MCLKNVMKCSLSIMYEKFRGNFRLWIFLFLSEFTFASGRENGLIILIQFNTIVEFQFSLRGTDLCQLWNKYIAYVCACTHKYQFKCLIYSLVWLCDWYQHSWVLTGVFIRTTSPWCLWLQFVAPVPVEALFKFSAPTLCFPGGSVIKNPPASVGDTREMGYILDLDDPLGEGNGNPLQYFMDRGAWQATIHGVANNQTLLYTTPPRFAYKLANDFKGKSSNEWWALSFVLHSLWD